MKNNPGANWHKNQRLAARQDSDAARSEDNYRDEVFYKGVAEAHKYSEDMSRKGVKNPGTPKKGESTRTFQGRKYYYMGRTLYFNKMMQIKDKVRTMGAGVAVTKSKGKGYLIWSTQRVHIPLMEVGGSDLFMEGEYNPKNKGRFIWTCRFCGTENFYNNLTGQVCEKCKRPIASWQKIGR